MFLVLSLKLSLRELYYFGQLVDSDYPRCGFALIYSVPGKADLLYVQKDALLSHQSPWTRLEKGSLPHQPRLWQSFTDVSCLADALRKVGYTPAHPALWCHPEAKVWDEFSVIHRQKEKGRKTLGQLTSPSHP